MVNPMQKVQFLLANTDQQKEEVFNLRYLAGYNNYPEARYVNHKEKKFQDDFEQGGLIVIGIDMSSKKIVSSIRMISSLVPVPYPWCYDYSVMANAAESSVEEVMKKSALIDRGCIHPDYINHGLFQLTLAETGNVAAIQGYHLLYTTWRKENEKLAKSMQNDGWKIPEKTYVNSQGVPYFFGFKIL